MLLIRTINGIFAKFGIRLSILKMQLESVSLSIDCWKGSICDRVCLYIANAIAVRNNINGQIIKTPDLMISTCMISLCSKGQTLMCCEFVSILTLKKDKSISANFGK